MIKILFVCMGNICRSPVAEGIMRSKLSESGLEEGIDFIIDSAGTNGIVGSSPDSRSQHVAMEHGVDISSQTGRRLTAKNGQDFDYIFCMDSSNLENAKRIIPSDFHHKLRMINDKGIGDPYQLGPDGFEYMYLQIDEATDKLIRSIVS